MWWRRASGRSFSDEFLERLLVAPRNLPALETLKAFNFILTTGVVLYLVLRRAFRLRRLAEEALRLSQQRFESVALATTDAIWDLNLGTKMVWWSAGIDQLFGYRAGGRVAEPGVVAGAPAPGR